MADSNGQLGYIHDGYTIHGFIAAVERLHPALRFSYRPILVQNRAVILDAMDKATDPARKELITAKAMASHVVEWDLTDKDGDVVKIEAASVLRMQPTLNAKLFNVVMGATPSDVNPDEVERYSKGAESALLDAAIAGKTPEEAEKDQEKNSVKG